MYFKNKELSAKVIIMTINFNIILPISLFIVAFGTIGRIIFWFFLNPDKAESLWAGICRLFRWLSRNAEYQYVKYNIQSKVNNFVMLIRKNLPNYDIQTVKLEWIDSNMTQEQFLKSNQLVIRMHKSTVTNRDIVNATVAFVSYSLLLKAKRYIAQYQKDAVDLFASIKILETEKNPQLISEFVDQYLYCAMENNKVNELYAQFENIHKVGLFFPVFVAEMTFLGDKVFGKAIERTKIYSEVKGLAAFLNSFSKRKLSQEGTLDYNGNYCKFAIRIVGKNYKIKKEGKNVYLNNIKQLSGKNETLYLIGDQTHEDFINEIVDDLGNHGQYVLFNKKKYKAIIKDPQNEDFEVQNYLIVLRKSVVKTYHNL